MNILTLVNFIVSYLLPFNEWTLSKTWDKYIFTIQIYDSERVEANNLLDFLINNAIVKNINIESRINSERLEIIITD